MKLSEWLLVVFIVLKLTGIISWSWWWVLLPLWIWVPLLILVKILRVISRALMSPEDRIKADLRDTLEEYIEALRHR